MKYSWKIPLFIAFFVCTLQIFPVLGFTSLVSMKNLPFLTSSILRRVKNRPSKQYMTSLSCIVVPPVDIDDKIRSLLKSSKTFLFMKGTRHFPQCGFSNAACKILDNLNVPYGTFNVFDDESIRQRIKEFSDWPTFPQLYIDEKFIGGLDIMQEMFESGELAKLLQAEQPADPK